ncbi:helix-turn-helix domain-containing protein [Amycolatopsis sp. NPDC004378]
MKPGTVRCEWRLRQVMLSRGLLTSSQLWLLLGQAGVNLPALEVHKLVAAPPENLSFSMLAALCDALDAHPGELIVRRQDVPFTLTDEPGRDGVPGVVAAVATR